MEGNTLARDGSDIFSKPAGSTTASGTTIESAKFNTLIDDIVDDLNLDRPVAAGGTGGSTASAARDNLVVSAKVISKSGDYTPVAADRSKLIRCTAALTLNYTAAATLGDGWFIDVEAGTGTTTHDPNGAELIDGSATLAQTVGQTVRVQCDGLAFFTRFLGYIIGTDVQATGAASVAPVAEKDNTCHLIQPYWLL